MEGIMDEPLIPTIQKMRAQQNYFALHNFWYSKGQMVSRSQWFRDNQFRIYQDGTLVQDERLGDAYQTPKI